MSLSLAPITPPPGVLPRLLMRLRLAFQRRHHRRAEARRRRRLLLVAISQTNHQRSIDR